MTKEAFSNWLLDLVFPFEASRASNSSTEEQFRMAESEGACNLVVWTMWNQYRFHLRLHVCRNLGGQ